VRKYLFHAMVGVLCASGLLTGGTVVPQKLRIIKLSGSAEFKPAKNAAWQSIVKGTALAGGYSLQTMPESEMHISFEPAITAIVFPNSMVNLENLLIDKDLKTIRMLMRMNNGRVRITMPPALGYRILFTMETPYASVNVSDADFEVFADDKSARVDVFRQSAKICNKIADLKTVVYANSHAIVNPKLAVIQINPNNPALAEKPGAQPALHKVAILSVQSEMDSNYNLEPLSDYIAQEIEKQSRTEVLFLDDVRAVLSAEGVSDLLSCHTDSCISKIGTLLGVDLVVIGKIGQLGERYLFNLKMIDALRGKTLTRVNTSVETNVGNILDRIPGMVGTLVQKSNDDDAAAAVAAIAVPVMKTAKDSLVPVDSVRDMVWIYAGSFSMGSELTVGDFDEAPRHTVSIKNYYLDRYETTKDEFEKVMGFNPSLFKGCGACPVENVSWEEAREYCAKVNKRLPTEAEWGYACLAGSKNIFQFGNSISSDNANFDGNKPYGGAAVSSFRSKPIPVGSFKPNAWGLYDMHGNVAEWCSDWYDAAYYGNSPENDPQGPANGKFKVVRGGGWNSDGAGVRCANRNSYNPTVRLNTIGFRCARDFALPTPPPGNQ
jgi:sulfatase modifying factor 1